MGKTGRMSAFKLIYTFYYDKDCCIRWSCIANHYGDQYSNVNSDVSPKELGISETVNEMVDKLVGGTYEQTKDGKRLIFKEAKDNNTLQFLSKLRKLSSMDRISKIKVTAEKYGRNDHLLFTTEAEYVLAMDSYKIELTNWLAGVGEDKFPTDEYHKNLGGLYFKDKSEAWHPEPSEEQKRLLRGEFESVLPARFTLTLKDREKLALCKLGDEVVIGDAFKVYTKKKVYLGTIHGGDEFDHHDLAPYFDKTQARIRSEARESIQIKGEYWVFVELSLKGQTVQETNSARERQRNRRIENRKNHVLSRMHNIDSLRAVDGLLPLQTYRKIRKDRHTAAYEAVSKLHVGDELRLRLVYDDYGDYSLFIDDVQGIEICQYNNPGFVYDEDVLTDIEHIRYERAVNVDDIIETFSDALTVKVTKLKPLYAPKDGCDSILIYMELNA